MNFQPMKSGSVQTLHFSSHWACVATIGCDHGHVNVYDSLFSAPPSSLIQQLCCLLKTKESHLTINMIEMQSQAGVSDCGCFAIACVTALCHAHNPSSLVWAQKKMREHLANGLTKHKLTPFPAAKKAAG